MLLNVSLEQNPLKRFLAEPSLRGALSLEGRFKQTLLSCSADFLTRFVPISEFVDQGLN